MFQNRPSLPTFLLPEVELMSSTSPCADFPVELSPFGLFMDAPIDQFAGVKNLGKQVGSRSASLQANFSTQQYLISLIGAERSLDSIDRIRTSVAKNTLIPMIYRSKQRLDHQINPSSIPEVAHLALAYFLNSIGRVYRQRTIWLFLGA